MHWQPAKKMSMLTYVLHINPHSGIYIMSGNNHSKLARANHNVEWMTIKM